jgi:hypothetical protein
MPFTFAHPAIVVHLSKSKLRLSLTGLIAGSIVPDFEFFFRMKVDENIGHHPIGFVLFDLPMALLLCYAYHNIVRNQFVNHLPNWYKCRFIGFINFNWNQYVKENVIRVLVSLIIGIASHLLWDACTHHDGFFVLLYPILSNTLVLAGLGIPVYSILQVLSSILGLWFMNNFFLGMNKIPVENTAITKNTNYWLLIGTICGCILVVRFIAITEYNSFWDIFFAAIGSGLYAWFLTSVIYCRVTMIRKQEL